MSPPCPQVRFVEVCRGGGCGRCTPCRVTVQKFLQIRSLVSFNGAIPMSTSCCFPPDRPAEESSQDLLGAGEFGAGAARDLNDLDARAAQCAGPHGVHPESDEGWAPSGSHAFGRRRLFAAQEIDPEEGPALVAASAQGLQADGWDVVVPEGGLPRLRAALGKLSIQLVYAAPAQRLAIVTHAGPYHVDDEARTQILAEELGNE